MTEWTQFHPTRVLVTLDGHEVNIDLEMVPLVQELWRLGLETKVACQDAGEAVREGGTRVAEAERAQASARLMGRAWLVVRLEDGPTLLEIWDSLGRPDDWVLRPVKKDTEPERWVSITFPRPLIKAAAQVLRPLTALERK
ncbi:hypothetical protein [Actinomadura macra]|uniref:hypothetical protein n=1 Tax=Actinomadura macra TaxID=46164 RepID=UPI00082AB2A5|nr:hypothetical protein [Actinomadura macra]